jgi:hypothetical protein
VVLRPRAEIDLLPFRIDHIGISCPQPVPFGKLAAVRRERNVAIRRAYGSVRVQC